MNEEDTQNAIDFIVCAEELQLTKLKQEETILLNMNAFFPQETWVMVLAILQKASDIENCTNASTFFRSLIWNKREIKVLLPCVFGILANRYNHYRNNDESFVETNRTSIPWNRRDNNKEPHRMTGLWKCRLVCKTWNDIIEDLHQNEDAGHFNMSGDFQQAKNTTLGDRLGSNRFDTRFCVQKFIKHFKMTHFGLTSDKPKKSPFLGRRVTVVHFIDRGNAEVYFAFIKELLEKFGRYVWYFQFSCCSGSVVDMYRNLVDFVQLMPNLKVIRLGYSDAHYSFSAEELQNITQEITVNPFPKLAKLTFLSICTFPVPLFTHIILQCREIHTLCMQHQEFPESNTIFCDILKSLTALSLEVCLVKDFERLEKCQFHLKLKKLHFNYCHHISNFHRFEDTNSDGDYSDQDTYKGIHVFVPWSRVFSVLENKFDSDFCTELALKLPMPYSNAERKSILSDSLSCRLNFPNCQRIKIYYNTVFSLDFLLPLKNLLEAITISGDIEKIKYWKLNSKASCVGESIEKTQVIKFLGKEGYMENSNISNVFPFLKTLIIRNERIDIKYNFEKGKLKSRYPPIPPVRRLTYEELCTPLDQRRIWGNPLYGFKQE